MRGGSDVNRTTRGGTAWLGVARRGTAAVAEVSVKEVEKVESVNPSATTCAYDLGPLFQEIIGPAYTVKRAK